MCPPLSSWGVLPQYLIPSGARGNSPSIRPPRAKLYVPLGLRFHRCLAGKSFKGLTPPPPPEGLNYPPSFPLKRGITGIGCKPSPPITAFPLTTPRIPGQRTSYLIIPLRSDWTIVTPHFPLEPNPPVTPPFPLESNPPLIPPFPLESDPL